MKKLFSVYFRSKPLLYAIALLCVAVIAANQYINHRSKLVNNPWIVTELLSGDRFLVKRDDRILEVKLCGISEGSKDYLRSLLDRGNGSVVLEKVSRQQNMIIAEVFMLRSDQQEIHLNTEMLMAGKATLGKDYKTCPNAEQFEIAAEIGK